MKFSRRAVAGAVGAVAGVALSAGPSSAAPREKVHRVAIHVDQSDPAVMNLALNNVSNISEYYEGIGESVHIDLVAYGPGLNMLRADKSPVKERIAHLASETFPARVSFSACGNTKATMEKIEGHPIPIVSQAKVVPSGVVHLIELEEKGWSYVRP